MKRIQLGAVGAFLFFLLSLTGIALMFHAHRIPIGDTELFCMDRQYAFVLEEEGTDFRLLRRDYQNRRTVSMRVSVENGKESSYQAEQLVSDSLGNAWALFSLYDESGNRKAYEIWRLSPEQEEASLMERGEDPAVSPYLFQSEGGILLATLSDTMFRENYFEVLVERIWFPSETPRPIRRSNLIIPMTTSGEIFVTAGNGVLVSDRTGNILRINEEGSTEAVFLNDGSQMSEEIDSFSLSNGQAYFYNVTEAQDYLEINGQMAKIVLPGLKELRARGYRIVSYSRNNDGTAIVSCTPDNVSCAWFGIGADGSITQIEDFLMPLSLWVPEILIASAILTCILILVGRMLLRFLVHARIVSTTLKVFLISLPLMMLGDIFLAVSVYQAFYQYWEQLNETMLKDFVWEEAVGVAPEHLTGTEYAYINELEMRNLQYIGRPEEISRPDGSRLQFQLNLSCAFYGIRNEVIYPLQDFSYICTPASQVVTDEEWGLLNRCMEQKSVETGWYPSSSGQMLAAAAPVFDENGVLCGTVRAAVYKSDLQETVMRWSAQYGGLILAGFLLLDGCLMLMIFALLRPLKRMAELIQGLERNETEKYSGTFRNHEVSEIIESVNRMADNIAQYLNGVSKTQESFEAFVPQKLVGLFRKESILEMVPGTSAVVRGALCRVRIAGMEGAWGTHGSGNAFDELNHLLERLLPEALKGGQVIRFYEDGMLLLYPQGTEDALHAVCSMYGTGIYGLSVGLDYRLIRLELAGNESRMAFAVHEEDERLVSNLQKLSARYQAGIIASEAFLFHMDEEKVSCSFRRLGAADVHLEGRREILYEIFEMDPASQKKLKEAQKEEFYRGIRLFEQEAWKEGRECFAEILRQNGLDVPARHYFNLCDQNLDVSGPTVRSFESF